MTSDDPFAGAPPEGRRWWKEAVIYQVYPRSFMDSNGDGIGDLAGIEARLDHLQALGVDAVWLGPHFDSPNADNGYDIRDYRKVMAEFGDLDDFGRLRAAMKARGLRLILDLVANHTSDQHPWFVDSRRGRDSPRRDFYIWREGKDGGPPNNWPSIFGGPAWSFDEASGQYYLHLFAPGQPDLNWDNPAVRAEIFDVMRFWLDRGAAGFRMDVIAFVSKPDGLPDLKPEQLAAPQYAYACGPRLHDYLREMRREVLDPYGAVAIGEAFGVTPEQARDLIDARRGELDMAFDFSVADLPADWTLPQLKAILARQDRLAGAHGWNTAFLGNHDQPRAVSRFGDDDPDWRMASAKTLATVLLTQRATPFIFQGEEIGMANYPFAGIEDFDDVWARTLWREDVLSGKTAADQVLARLRRFSRDNSRTPMQWSAGPNAGFTTGRPWLKVNPDAAWVNVRAQAGDEASALAHYRRLIALRKAEPALVYGARRDLDPSHPRLYACARRLGERALLVAANFGREPLDHPLPAGVRPEEILIASEPDPTPARDGTLRLRGWESVVFSLAEG